MQKALVEGAPSVLKEAVSKDAAEDIKSKVEAWRKSYHQVICFAG